VQDLIPDAHHVARTCRASSLDPVSKLPTPSSFEFRRSDDGGWKDQYLSVNWLELLAGEALSLNEKIARLKLYLYSNPPFSHIKPSSTSVIAAIPVSVIHSAVVGDLPTKLSCKRAHQGEGDPHSGIHPSPGVEGWLQGEGDGSPEAEELAVRQFLCESVVFHAPGRKDA
jgi:hypothetical protein